MLTSYGLLNDPNAAKDWVMALNDLKDIELVTGIRKAKDHSGYLTLGQFRHMCKLEKINAAHKPYKALPVLKSDEETREYWKAKRKSEVGL